MSRIPRIKLKRATLMSAALALVAAPLTVVSVASPASAADPVTLNLMNINDFHGRIDGNTVNFAGTVEQLREQAGEAGSVFLSSGDNIGASLFASSSAQDQPTIDVLNALGMKASAVGNHEFDGGYADLTGRVTDEADWSYLGANVYDKGTTNPALPEFEVTTVQGLRVGVIGAVTQETPTLVTPSGIADLDFGDPVAAVNRVADTLSDGNDANGEADVLVAEYHEGAGSGTPDGATPEEEIAAGGAFADIATKTSAKVDAIFNGHTHKQYAWDVAVPGAPGKTRPIVQTGSYGENVGQITLSVDPDTDEVLAHTARNVARTTTPAADLVAKYPRVAEVKTIVDKAVADAAVIGNRPVGKVTEDITTAFKDGARDDRASESTLGNLVADSLRETLSSADRGSADIGVVNPGGLRADLLYAGDTASNPENTDGVVTFAEANAVLPFVNNLNTVTLTGAQVKTMLEQQWQTDADGNIPSRPFLNLGLSKNVSYTYDPAAAQGEHITSVSVNDKPLDPAADYRIGTFSFLATGGDNFRVLAEGTDLKDSGLIDRDAWISYLQDNSPLTPSFARRGVATDTLPSEVSPGEEVSFTLSKLDLTSLGSPKNTTVDVALEDSAGETTPVGSFPVTDGAAAVTFTVPAGASGAQTLVATAGPSKTVVRAPFTVKAVDAGDPKATVNARSKADRRTETVTLAAYARNTDTVPLDIRFTTPSGETAKFSQVAPGKAAYHEFKTGKGTVEAGAIKVATYKNVDGKGYHKVYDAPYDALTATLNPRGRAEGGGYKDRKDFVLTGTFRNTGAHTVSARMKTEYGVSKAKNVKPGRTAYFSLRIDKSPKKASKGVIAAYKLIDGKGYYSEFGIWFPRK